MRTLLRNLLLAGLSSIVTLCLAELALRFGVHRIIRDGESIEIGKVFDLDDPPVGFSLKPGSTRITVKGGAYVIRDRINEQGMRDVLHQQARPPGFRRVLVLGDSFMYGDGVRMEESMPRRLATMSPGTEYINAGVRAWNLDQEYLYYKERGRKWKPDVVLLAFFVNDLIRDRAYDVIDGPDGLPVEYNRSAEARQRDAREAPRGVRGAVSGWFRGHSVLYALVRSRLDGFALRGLRGGAGTVTPQRPPEVQYLPIFRVHHPGGQDPPEWLRAYRVLDELKRMVSDDGGRLVVILVPAPWQVSEEAWNGWIEWLQVDPVLYSRRAPVEMATRWCERSKTPCLDLFEGFAGHVIGRLYLAQDFHWTAEGHQVAAEAVMRWFVAQGIL